MSGFFMGGGRLRSAIRFHQDKSSGVILLLKHVEPSNARLLHARVRIGNRCLLEGFDRVRFDVNVHVNNQHKSPCFSVLLFLFSLLAFIGSS